MLGTEKRLVAVVRGGSRAAHRRLVARLLPDLMLRAESAAAWGEGTAWAGLSSTAGAGLFSPAGPGLFSPDLLRTKVRIDAHHDLASVSQQPHNRPMSATIRDAVLSDAAEVHAVAGAAWRDTYEGLLRPSTVEAFVEAAYSVETLQRRFAHHTFLVIENEGRIIAFANAVLADDHLNLAAIYALPDSRGQGAGTMLLTALAARFPGVPVAADVLSGNRKGEVFYEHRGFHPREILKDELFGEPVVERRWWLGTPPPVVGQAEANADQPANSQPSSKS